MELSVTNPQQRIFLTGTLPEHLESVFYNTTLCNDDTVMLRDTVDRPEIAYHVVKSNKQASVNKNVSALVTALVKQLRDDERIIVFFQDSKLVEAFAQFFGCAKYHSKLPRIGNECKEANLHDWDSGETKVLASTTAAAVGVDRPYIKFTVVVQSTYGLVTYSQEAGRGGRRGQPSHSIILTDNSIQYCHKFTGPLDQRDLNCLAALTGFQANQTSCRRLLMLRTLDGVDMCVNRKGQVTCKEILGCNPCDVCAPDGEMALLFRSAVDDAHNYVRPFTVNRPELQAVPPPPSQHKAFVFKKLASAPPSVSGTQDSDFAMFDSDVPSASLLAECDRIERAYQVRHVSFFSSIGTVC